MAINWNKKTTKTENTLIRKIVLRALGIANRNRLTNSTKNLEWATDAENLKHARDLGMPNHKINMKTAKLIRRKYAKGGHTYRSLAALFYLSQTEIGLIIKGKRWV